MPVQLRVHAARPLNDCVPPDWMVEGSDYDVRARCLSGADRAVHISDPIACALEPEWIRDWGLETKDGYGADRSQHQLGHGAAWRRGYCEDALLGRCAPKCSDQACNEAVEILRRHVDVSRVVLGSDSYAHYSGCLRTLRECAEVSRFVREANRQKDRNRRSNEDFFQVHSVS